MKSKKTCSPKSKDTTLVFCFQIRSCTSSTNLEGVTIDFFAPGLACVHIGVQFCVLGGVLFLLTLRLGFSGQSLDFPLDLMFLFGSGLAFSGFCFVGGDTVLKNRTSLKG